jgi:hypothetical protein
VFLRCIDESVDVFGLDGEVGGDLRCPGVAGGDEDVVHIGALREFPGDGMFASTIANEQDPRAH